ncbi:MAG: helix-turn-helix transcriptional regulator [Patescibacteria group bacterium]
MKKEQKKSIKNMTKFSDLHKKWMQNPKFRKAYDDLEPEFAIIRALIKMRIEKKMSQKDLAKKLGTKQPAIARFESGAYNPTLSFLKKLSTALGGKLEIKI